MDVGFQLAQQVRLDGDQGVALRIGCVDVFRKAPESALDQVEHGAVLSANLSLRAHVNPAVQRVDLFVGLRVEDVEVVGGWRVSMVGP